MNIVTVIKQVLVTIIVPGLIIVTIITPVLKCSDYNYTGAINVIIITLI